MLAAATARPGRQRHLTHHRRGLRDAADSYTDTVMGSHASPQTVSPHAETGPDALYVLAVLASCCAA